MDAFAWVPAPGGSADSSTQGRAALDQAARIYAARSVPELLATIEEYAGEARVTRA